MFILNFFKFNQLVNYYFKNLILIIINFWIILIPIIFEKFILIIIHFCIILIPIMFEK